MHEPVIEIEGLRKTYGTTVAVDGLDLRVQRGEIVGLLGPNGAGKTTTIECLLGLRQPDGGRVRLFGEEGGAARPAIRARLGVQLQTTGLLPQLTVQEQVALFSSLFPRSMPATQVLSQVGLGEKAKAATRSLSGGQKQRLAVALAMVNDPELMFLDEPTTGLDPQARRSLWDVIDALRAQGKSVLLTTHYMEEAAHLCDHVAIVDHGRLIEWGSPEALVRTHFREAAIETVLRGDAEPAGLRALDGVSRVLRENGHVTLYTTDVPQTMAGLLHLADGGGLAFEDMIVRQATLEDVFLKLTGRRIRE